MTVPVLLLRHGVTAWNVAGRIQGRTDVPLSADGRASLERLGLPARFAAARWYTSPLLRALQTAAALRIEPVVVEPRLVELDWGEWEGSTRAALRARHGREMAHNERRGIDFRPDAGESSREMRARLEAWLREVGGQGEAVAAVTHKGVVQMALAMATGWDLVSKRPHRLRWECAHLFEWDPRQARLAVAELDIELEARPPGDEP